MGSLGVCVFPGARNPPGLLNLLLIPSSPAAKMPSPRTVTPGPEPQSPKEPGLETQPPAQGTGQISRGKEPSAHHEETTRPGLDTLKRAFSWASQRASQAPKEDPGRLRRSSRSLFQSFRRRTLDEGLAAGQSQRAAVPEEPCMLTDGVSQQASTRVGPKDLESEAGEASLTTLSKRGN